MEGKPQGTNGDSKIGRILDRIIKSLEEATKSMKAIQEVIKKQFNRKRRKL